MEDLRDEKKKIIEEGKKPIKKISKFDIFKAVLFKLFLIINNFIIKVKNKDYLIIYYIVIGSIVFFIATHPLEIGTFLGDWAWYFWYGLVKNFK